jgi:hypothetical protein
MTNTHADARIDDGIGDGGGNGGNGDDEEFCSQDARESVESKQSGLPSELCIERRHESSTQPATPEGCSRGKYQVPIGTVARAHHVCLTLRRERSCHQ